MDINEAIAGRRAVRAYTAQAVDEESIHRLIDAAIEAPSAINQQPWTFTVVRDQGLLDRISREAKAQMLATGAAGPDHHRGMLEDPAFHIFYHAPALILISGAQDGPWIVEDCSLAAENLMLAAYGMGLGSCWIGFAQGYLNTPEGKAVLGLSAATRPVAPIIVGHPQGAAPPVARRTPQIHWLGQPNGVV
jgi:nitroreductase